MKKILLVLLVVAVGIGFAVSSYSAEMKEETKVTTKGDTTTETTKVKAGDVKAEQKVTTTPEATKTEEKVKSKEAKIEKKEVDTAAGSAGKTKVNIKNGALKKLDVEWVYYKQGTEYIIDYKVKNKENKKLMSELNLTKDQMEMIGKGTHQIVSTSPYTADDIRAEFRDVILKDLASVAQKKK